MSGRDGGEGAAFPPRLRALGRAGRALVTAFLVGIAAAFVAAHVNLHFAHAGADGEPGLGMEDLRRTFHGRPGWTLLASKIDGGTMERHVPIPSEKATLLAWAAGGARREDFGDARRALDRRCVRCHAPGREKEDRPFARTPDGGSEWELVRTTCEPDTGVPAGTLARSSHAHLFGFSLLFLALGGAFALTDAGRRMKIAVTCALFGSMFLDVGCWWLAKVHVAFCWGIAAGGALMGAAVAYVIARCLWEMWGPRPAVLRV